MLNSSGILITGTDTGVGKTYVSCILIRQLLSERKKVFPIKSIACGGIEDAQDLQTAHGGELNLKEINPLFFQAPLAPYSAAQLEGKSIDLSALVQYCKAQETPDQVVLVEGVGGWEVPLTPTENFSDFATSLGYPVILVVGNKLGAINHALLSLAAIRRAKLECYIIINTQDTPDLAQKSNIQFLREKEGAFILGEVSPNATSINFHQS